MTKDMYKKKLCDIERLLKRGRLEEAKKSLDKLEKFKPVSLKLIALLAKYYLMINEYHAFRATLDNKWWTNYAYDGIDEILDLYEQCWEKYSNKRDLLRIQFIRKLVLYIGTDTKEAEELERQWDILEKMGESYYLAGQTELLEELEKQTYMLSDIVWNNIIQVYFIIKGISKSLIPGTGWIEKKTNMGYLKERMKEKESVFILVAEDTNIGMCKAIGRILREIGKKVYLLEPPEKRIETEDLSGSELLQKSFAEAYEDVYSITFIPTYYLESKSGQRLDNRALLIQYLSENKLKTKLATVIGSGALLDDLSMQNCLKKSFSRFNLSMGDIFERNFSFGWVGDYIAYISRIYNYNVAESLKKECETCAYSIVIPARNSATSLRYTLQTCLDLDYPKGDYEIVISDNSTSNNAEVYNLCEQLKDPRIKYYHTPRDLHLSKSFEFAFLQTKGEFILSIGSNDAILPWALRVLDEIRKKYPQEEIIQWERGFYAWPGFNGGQENQFVIPRGYKQGEYNEGYMKGSVYLTQILHNPGSMYALPMLYINSGFKRSYMDTLLKKTGRLWDGICQDIYMGIVNSIINDKILNIRYPLTIAGMTDASIGANCVKANTSNAQSKALNEDVKKTSNVGGFSMSMIERLMPQLRSDVSSLYNSLLRAVARGILPEEYMWKNFEWKKMFAFCVQKLDIRDIEYDKLIHYARYTASWHGQDFLQWFDDAIYNNVMQPQLIDEQAMRIQRRKKSYQEGHTAEGGLVVDASKYGVTNSYEAMQLFLKLSELE